MTSILNYIKMYKFVQKLLVGDTQADTQRDRQHGDLISLTFFLREVGQNVHPLGCECSLRRALLLSDNFYFL
jgi:hypothetical protein